MITLLNLDKKDKKIWLPKLFDLLYDNMREITPSGLTYEQEKAQWLGNVSPAIDKPARQIIMCFIDDELAGYIQYYISERLLMIEEIQLKKEYHCTLTFHCFCQETIKLLFDDIEFVEAFAEKRNFNSQKLMKKLGMKLVEENYDSPFVHFQGCANEIKQIFLK